MIGRICASLSSYSEKDDLSDADMVEIRLDLLGQVPHIPNKELLVTYRGNVDLSLLPSGFNGMIDVGETPRPNTHLTVVSSYHNYDLTPSYDAIVNKLMSMDGDIHKGAFAVKGFADLHNIFVSSEKIDSRHVLLGMGEFGKITRIRKTLLKNEFSFGYVGEPTAPGQLSIKDMRKLGDDCMITGIVGCPLSKSKSPIMHEVAMEIKGLNGIYLKFETGDLEHCADIIREYNIKGINVTIPHKQNIIQQLDCMDKTAQDIGAVNTVVNENSKLKGYNTDIIGIETALKKGKFEPKGKKAVIMGSGGAARACAYILLEKGCHVTITGRNESTAKSLASDMGCEYKQKDSVPVQMNDLIVNSTPVGMYGEGEYPLNLKQLNKDHTVFDMVYGRDTPIISRAISVGARTVSGADMLAGQGAASFGLWTGDYDQFETMRSVLQ
ncbi:MAG: shikimate dehydrogenase [Candidatus Methanogranum gryphiswaldense]|nr:MAG: shikimate dehydrogenase [Candidatus Methanogranum sp. U3.2.1]